MASIPRAANVARTLITDESTRLAACLFSAIDLTEQAKLYASRKGISLDFGAEDVRTLALTLYIRRRDEGSRQPRG
jgi:hypothetical protein